METADPYIALTNRELGKRRRQKIAQTFATIYNQMLVSISLRNILPMGLTGILPR